VTTRVTPSFVLESAIGWPLSEVQAQDNCRPELNGPAPWLVLHIPVEQEAAAFHRRAGYQHTADGAGWQQRLTDRPQVKCV
jgi:hypothetical protein